MKRVFALSILLLIASFAAVAQEIASTPQATPQPGGNLLQQLALTPDQMRAIRQINQQRKPQMADAQERVREAGKALDAAIYSDSVDENEVKARLSELQQAQADVAKIRFTNELAIRRVLTLEQLGHFRDLRLRVAQAREAMDQTRQRGIPATGTSGAVGPNRPLRQMIKERNMRVRQQRNAAATPAVIAPAEKPKP